MSVGSGVNLEIPLISVEGGWPCEDQLQEAEANMCDDRTYQAAIEVIKNCAMAGHPRAEYYVGFIHAGMEKWMLDSSPAYEGRRDALTGADQAVYDVCRRLVLAPSGESENRQVALKYYHRAAAKGDSWANYELGWLHQTGIWDPNKGASLQEPQAEQEGVCPYDEQKAMHYYHMSALGGNPAGQFELMQECENKGQMESAHQLLVLASQSSYPPADWGIGTLCARCDPGNIHRESASGYFERAVQTLTVRSKDLFPKKALQPSYVLGDKYLSGELGSVNEQRAGRAMELYAQASEGGELLALISASDCLLSETRWTLAARKEAVIGYKKAAQQGVLKAILRLGQYYLFGYEGIAEPKPQTAVAWFKKGREMPPLIIEQDWGSFFRCIFYYSWCTWHGVGTEQNQERAINRITIATWFDFEEKFRASLADWVQVPINRAQQDKNMETAIRAYTRTTPSWIQSCVDLLADPSTPKALELDQVLKRRFTPDGEMVNIQSILFGTAASAMINLSPQDVITGLLATAEQGHARARFYVGQCYETGWGGVEKNQEMAVSHYRTAAEMKDARAQYAYAVCLNAGIGVLQDKTEARLWLQQSAAQNFAPAVWALNNTSFR